MTTPAIDNRGSGRAEALRAIAILMTIAFLVTGCEAASSRTPAAGSAAASGAPNGPGGGGAASPGAASSSASPRASVPPSGSGAAGPTASAPAGASGSPAGSPGPSTSPGTDPGGPAAPGDQAAKFGFRAKGMSHEVMAFVTTSQINYALNTMDFDVVSTVAFFSLEPGSDGHLKHDGRWAIWNSARVDRLIEMAHAHGTKVVISLARFSWSPGETRVSTAVLSSAAKRLLLANEVAAEVARRHVDGINIDFEPIPVGQKANFTQFVHLVRAALDRIAPNYQLTFDVTGHHESYDVGGSLRPGGADAVYLMGYHYAGTWSKVAGSTAPLGGPRYDVNDTITSLLRSARPDQVIVGLPYYGHTWPTRSGAIHARTVGGGHDVLYADAIAAAARLGGGGYDKVEQSHWVAFREGGQWYQMYFDDAQSLGVKWDVVKRRKLLGTGVWTIAFEGGANALDSQMRRAFLVPKS